MHVYPGVIHREISMNETVLERVKNWYTQHGVLRSNPREAAGRTDRGSPERSGGKSES